MNRMISKVFHRKCFRYITLIIIFIFSGWIVLHNSFYGFNDSFTPPKVLNYEFIQGVPVVHLVFNLILVLLGVYLFVIGSKNKGWKLTLITFLFVGNSVVGLFRNQFVYSILEDNHYRIHIRKYEFLWQDSDAYYCEVNAYSSVLLGTIQSGRNSVTFGYVDEDDLILQEISGNEILNEVRVALSNVCKKN